MNAPRAINPVTRMIEEDNDRIRRENRRYVLRKARGLVKWTLITAGAVAIYNTVTSDNDEPCEDEDTEV